MNPTNHVEFLQRVADFRIGRNSLRRNAGWFIFWGVVAVGMGLTGLELSELNSILILIGLFLIGSGIWNRVSPSAFGFITDSVALLFVALWNLFIGVTDHHHLIVLLGAAQIIWSIRGLISYRRYAPAFAQEHLPEHLQWIEDRLAEIRSARFNNAGDVIAFKAEGTISEGKHWKGKLYEEMAVFVDDAEGDLFVVRNNEVVFAVRRKQLLGDQLIASFQIRNRKMKGTISPRSFDIYMTWKNGAIDPLNSNVSS